MQIETRAKNVKYSQVEPDRLYDPKLVAFAIGPYPFRGLIWL
jgi:hypothetical protein